MPYANWLMRRRIPIVICILCLVAAAAAGISRLSFKSDYRMFFSADNPQLIAFDKLQKTFAKTENVLLVIAPQDANVFTARSLTALAKMTELSWQIPFANRVDSITNFQHSEAQGDELFVRDLVENPDALTGGAIAEIRHIAINEPLLLNRLISPDGATTGISVTVRMPEDNQSAHVPVIAGKAREIAAQIESVYPELDIRLTGSIMMDNAFGEASEHDGQILIPIMFTIVILTLWLLLRSFTGTLLVIAVIACSIVVALGLAGWLNIDLSPTSVASPNIILTLAVADCVHLLSGFYRRARGGMEKSEALKESFSSNFKAIFLTSATTAIGFLSMNASDAPPFRDLGNITAIGVAAAFMLTVSFVPAMMCCLPVKPKADEPYRKTGMDLYVSFLLKRSNGILAASLVLILSLLAFIPSIELNDEFVKYFDHSIDFRDATDFATDRLTGIYYIDFAVDSGQSSGVTDPGYMAGLERFANWLRAQPEVLHVFSITDIIKRLNRNMHGDDPAYYRLTDDRSLMAQYLLLYEMSLPFGLDLNDRIDIDKSSTRLTATLYNISSRQVLDLENRANAWIAANGFDNATTYGTGTTIMFAHIGQRNIQTMLQGTAGALLLISLILVISLRSVKIGLISLLPNLIPAAMAFGLWGALIGQVGLAVSVVAAMTLGIVVDDTVHFLSHYLHSKRALAHSTHQAIHYAFTNVGNALLITSFVLIAGFSVLACSSFEINASMGGLTAIAIMFALVADFLFLPSLLLKVEELKK